MKNALRLFFSLVLFFSLLAACQFLPITAADAPLKEALFYTRLANLAVQCQLCPRRCVIPEGRRGFCRVRENRGGTLYALSYGKLVSLNDVDPIEKKPLFHFLPSTKTMSLATASCNLRCKFCQNWEISQRAPEEIDYTYLEPAELVKKTIAADRPTIAYTYTEPTIFYEYMLETAVAAKQAGIRNVMHSNGYINVEPLRKLAKYLDAANIDLKGFSDDYYGKLAEGTLEPVLQSLKVLKEEGVHIEITNLIVSGYNDDPQTIRKMCAWIKDNLGSDVPLHFSRAFPMYKLTGINATPYETLLAARDIATSCGLNYVFIGNLVGNPFESTYCPKCGKVVIRRNGYFVEENNLDDGKCKFCGYKIAGVWS